jgi:BirA family transcriptional regulator, biotin operon repressor / biotin---[acetyl-CoA-carboxylase] ligase
MSRRRWRCRVGAEMPFALGPRAASAGYRLAVFDKVGSTNAEAMLRARAGEAGPIWFVTTEQTAGRGRRFRPWVAPRGNLASSILEVMDVAPAAAATLGFAAGLALEQAVRRLGVEAALRMAGAEGLNFSLKWPNDVLANGRKLTGILLEAEAVVGGGLAVVVGIGTNVVSAPEGTPTPATSLRALGIEASAEDLFAELSDGWAEFRGIWNDGEGFPGIRRLWLERAAGLGEPVSIKSGEKLIEGTFDTIDEQGCMIVRTTGGSLVSVTAGDVYFGSAASTGSI